MAREFTSMLGIDIVVVGSSPATEAAIAEALEKKIIKEVGLTDKKEVPEKEEA